MGNCRATSLRLCTALAALWAIAIGSPSYAAQENAETSWATCVFAASGGTGSKIALIILEPFTVPGDIEYLPDVSSVFEEEVGIGTVVPGYHHWWYPNGSSQCRVDPSKSEVNSWFLKWQNWSDYGIRKTISWRPSNDHPFIRDAKRKVTPVEKAEADADLEVPTDEEVDIRATEVADREAEEAARLAAEREAAERLKRLNGEELAKQEKWLANELARKREYERKVAEHELEKRRREREFEARSANFRRVLADQQRRHREYEAAMERHRRCTDGDTDACNDIRAGKPALSEQEQQTAEAEKASTDTDARRCMSEPALAANQAFKGNTSATIVNGCETPVDVRICLERSGGWNCATSWGVAPQARWSHSSFEATGEVFWDARVAGSSRALQMPN